MIEELSKDPTVFEVTRVYDDLLAVLLFCLARASLEMEEYYVALKHFEEFKSLADRYPNEGWLGEYMTTLSRAHQSRRTPPEELPRIRETLQHRLLISIQGAHVDHLPDLLDTVWVERQLLSPDVYPAVIKHSKRLLERRPRLYTLRVRSAWFALKLGQEEEARTLLREASRYFAGQLVREGDQELASKILSAAAGKLTLQRILVLVHRLSMRHFRNLLPPKRGTSDPAPPEQQ